MFYGCLIHNLSSLQLQRGDGVQVLRNPHHELTMDLCVMLLTPHKADYVPCLLSHFLEVMYCVKNMGSELEQKKGMYCIMKMVSLTKW